MNLDLIQLIHKAVKGTARHESGIAIFASRITLNYAYSPLISKCFSRSNHNYTVAVHHLVLLKNNFWAAKIICLLKKISNSERYKVSNSERYKVSNSEKYKFQILKNTKFQILKDIKFQILKDTKFQILKNTNFKFWKIQSIKFWKMQSFKFWKIQSFKFWKIQNFKLQNQTSVHKRLFHCLLVVTVFKIFQYVICLFQVLLHSFRTGLNFKKISILSELIWKK